MAQDFYEQLKKLAKDDGKLLILEVENPDYADEGPARDYMLKRIGFYRKNGHLQEQIHIQQLQVLLVPLRDLSMVAQILRFSRCSTILSI